MTHDLPASVLVDEGVPLPRRRPASISGAVARTRRQIAGLHRERRVGRACGRRHVVRGLAPATGTILTAVETPGSIDQAIAGRRGPSRRPGRRRRDVP